MGWRTVIVFDGHVADGNFSKMYLQQIIILACLFVIELIATLNVIRHEAKDIPEISSSIAEISAGNYNFRINSKSENEIGLIAKSVDNLAQTLTITQTLTPPQASRTDTRCTSISRIWQ